MTPPDPGPFREEALRQALQAEEGRGVVRVAPPWTWALLGVALSGVVTGLLAACLGRVDIHGRARGILRPRSGVRVIVARLDGTVEGVLARSGQEVRAGQGLVRLEAPPVRAALLEAERHLETVRRDFAAAARRQDRAHAEQTRRLARRGATLEEERRNQGQCLLLAERNLARNLDLEREGVQSPARVDEVRDALAQARGHLSRCDHALEQLSQERASLDQGRQETLWQRSLTIRSAETRLASQSLLLAQREHPAPEDGVVEAMLVHPGEVVRAGQALCKLIPREAPLQVVAFLPERDRAFVRAGDEVVLELDQLPYAEFGTARAKVERISDDLASGFELQEALGDQPLAQVPAFRVELRLTDTRAPLRAGIRLRSGMLLQARFTLRRQRLVTLVLDPLRKWFR
jgi:multidrug resistance efflux pump